MEPTVRTPAAVILLCAVTTNLGYLRSEVYELIAVACFLLLSALCLPLHKGTSRPTYLMSILLLAAFVWAFTATSAIPRIVLAGAVLFAASFRKERPDATRREASVLALTAFAFGFYILGIKHCDFLWHITERFSVAYSHFVGSLAAKDIRLSASASGLHTVVLFLIIYLSLFTTSDRRGLLLAIRGLLVPFVLMGAFILAGSAWEGSSGRVGSPPTVNHLDLQPLLVLAGLVILWIESTKVKLRTISLVPSRTRTILAAAGALVLCAGILSLILPEPGVGGQKRVLLYDRGHIMWGTPVFGRYGDKSGGMFGNLPRYLEFRGFEAKHDTVSEASLKDVDVIVAINLGRPFTEEEHRLAWDFVERGGALLALGDHTGTEMIREPFNALLKPVGIEFNFDSAKGFPESWVDGMEWRPHEITRVIEDESSTQIWTGASLAVGQDTSPLILGKFAWSDSGNVNDPDRAYLGDFFYRQGELLGDIVLVAQARYGRGKVLVFGDTSTFQNGALVVADEFADGCMEWLCKKGKGETFRTARTVVGLGLVVVAFTLILLSGLSHLGLFLFSLALLASPAVSALTGPPPRGAGTAAEAVAYIDKAHGERFDLYSWGDDSIGGFVYNLMRNGFLPFLHRHFSEGRLDESDLLFVMGPTRDFSPDEIRSVDRFVREGNVLLVNMGYIQYKVAPSLMRHFGFSISNIPLGRVETEGLGKPVRFYDAYPVECAGSDTTVVCEGYGYPIAISKRYGEGRVIAMGDTRFFQNKNLEHRDKYIEENVMFLRQLLLKLDQEVFAG